MWGLSGCAVKVGGEAFTSGAAGTGSVGAVISQLMLAGLGDVGCGAGEEVEGVKCDDLWAIVNRVRAEDFYLGGIAGAGTGVGDGGSEQVADDAFVGFAFFGDDADGRVCRETRVLPGVHGVDEGWGDFVVTEQEVQDAAAKGVLEQGCVDGGYGEEGVI